MASVVQNAAIDCADACGLARFRSEVPGRPLHRGAEPGDPAVEVMRPGRPPLHSAQVPAPRAVKNRVHPRPRPATARAEEAERLPGLGAVLVDARREPGGAGRAAPADPEGNGFCVLRSAAERAAM